MTVVLVGTDAGRATVPAGLDAASSDANTA